MPLNEELPVGLCSACTVSALSAADFRTICRQTARKWNSIVQLMGNLPKDVNKSRTLFAVIETDQMILINDFDHLASPKSAAKRLTHKLNPKQKKEAVCETLKNHRYQCPDCGKKFLYVQQLYQHLKESMDLKRACYICAKIMSRDELVTHLSEEHNRKPYDCKKCPALLRSYSQYAKHLQKVHSQGSCTCGDCGRSFRTANAFKAHLSIHTVKTCPGCDKVFRNQTCYFYHVKKCCSLDSARENKHKKGMMFEVKNRKSDKKVKVGLHGRTVKECICDYCNKKFARKKFVSAHIQIVHMKNTHKPCIYCGKFLAAAHMTEHVKKHEIVRTFKCEQCGIALKTRLGYIQHLRLHSGERPYACQYCGETFSASSRRSEHIRKVHKSSEIILKHACSHCPARFRLPYRLKRHIASQHNIETDGPLFDCNKCHEKFSSCRGLQQHSRILHPIIVDEQKTKKEIKCRVYSEPVKSGEVIEDC